MISKTRHYIKKFVTTSKPRHVVKKFRHDVQKFVMASKSSSWHQDVHNEVKMFVMKSKTRQDVKKFVMASKTRHDVKKFVMKSKCSSWHKKVCHGIKKFMMTLKTRHSITNMLNSLTGPQKHVMTSTNSPWSQKVHNVKKFAMKSKSSWRQKVCQDVKKYFVTTFTCRSRVIND